MAQHDYDLANQSGAAFRSDLNNALLAVVSLNAGASEPSTTFAYQLWYDTTNDVLKIRNSGNTAWITLRDKLGFYWADSGTADAMAITPSPAYTTYAAGMNFLVKKSASANTGSCTLNVNALGAIDVLMPGGADPLAGELPASELLHLAYNGSNFVVLNPRIVLPPVGQCRLTKSGANLLLSPKGGNQITIYGVRYIIPSAGVTLSASGASAGTTYFIYAYISGGAVTLERSTTGHSTDTTTGQEVKTGDATRTLVGMARAITGPAWADSAQQRLVRSWFNDPGLVAEAAIVADVNITSDSYVLLHSNMQCEMLNWADDRVLMYHRGAGRVSVTQDIFVAFADGDTTALSNSEWLDRWQSSPGDDVWINNYKAFQEPSEGYHAWRVIAKRGAAVTLTFEGSSVEGRNSIGVIAERGGP